jgi:hypothetical protein
MSSQVRPIIRGVGRQPQSGMTSEEFWRSPIPRPKPPTRNKLSLKSKSKETLPEPVETREEERDGRIFKVTVLPGYSGKAAPIPEKTTAVGQYKIGENGKVTPLRPTGSEDY